MKIAAFETRPGTQEFFQSKLTNHELYFTTDPANPQTIEGHTDIEVLSTHTDSKVDKQLIDLLPNLKLIATRTTGFDHIDLSFAQSKNIPVCNVPTYGEHTVAEFTFALLLAISRKIPAAVDRVKTSGQFNFFGLQGFDLFGKTLGIIGTGKIGTNVARIANGFGMKILAFDVYPNQALADELKFQYVQLEELLGSSDIITLHAPYLPSTHHLLNSQNMAQIKKGAVLLDTARGALIETQALVKALQDGIVSAAGLDVLEEEKGLNQPEGANQEIVNLDKQLIGMKNVLITPHTAFNTKEAEERILQTTVDNIQSFINGQPQNVVKPQ